MAEFVVKLKQK